MSRAHRVSRRFALHVLPRGFNRIRHYGLLANRSSVHCPARAPGACARAAGQRPNPCAHSGSALPARH
jgi:hypothetical protein